MGVGGGWGWGGSCWRQRPAAGQLGRQAGGWKCAGQPASMLACLPRLCVSASLHQVSPPACHLPRSAAAHACLPYWWCSRCWRPGCWTPAPAQCWCMATGAGNGLPADLASSRRRSASWLPSALCPSAPSLLLPAHPRPPRPLNMSSPRGARFWPALPIPTLACNQNPGLCTARSSHAATVASRPPNHACPIAPASPRGHMSDRTKNDRACRVLSIGPTHVPLDMPVWPVWP